MAAVTLSNGLLQKLHATAQRIRTFRLVQGLAVTLLALVLPLFAILSIDYIRDGLGPIPRLAFLLVWPLFIATVVWRAIVRPLRQRLDLAALAALVEEHHPELAERLTSSVELAGDADLYHGSPEMIALLVQETEKQTSQIPFVAVVSPTRARNVGLCAAGMLLLIAIPTVVWPTESRVVAHRFFLSWSAQKYQLAAVEGDRISALGRPITFTAHAEPTPGQRADILPRSATLVLTHANGREERVPMLVQRPGEYSARLEKLPGNATYRIEAGSATSPDYAITAIEPVELAAERPLIVTTPPAYASEQIAPQQTHGLSSVNVLQHGTIRFEFAFTRPAVAARLEWTTGDKETRKTEVIELPLSANRKSATVERRLSSEAEYRVILEAEHGIRTESSLQTAGVWIDRPPGFKDFALAKKDSKPVHPQDQVPFSFRALDDIAVMKAETEIRVNDLKSKSLVQTIPLAGAGTTEAGARHHVTLAGIAKPGDRVYFRVRIMDNRNVPDAGLTPHVIYHPADDWLSVTVASNVAPLAQKGIQDEHAEIHKKIDQIKADLTKERTQVQQLHQAQGQQRDLTPEQIQNLQDLQSVNRAAEESLTDLARDFENTPEMRPLTDALREVARQEIHKSEQALQQAEKKPAQRGKELEKANLQLGEALRKLNDLQKKNQEVARDRQDQRKLEQLAEREKAVADKLAELQEKDPQNKQELQKVQQEQAQVAAELQQLLQQNESLKQALEAMRAEQARELAEKARDLAEQQRQLATDNVEREQKERIARLAELAKKQEELNKQAQQLAEETKQPATTAQKAPLNTDEAKKALEALQKGAADEALRKQHQAALEFDRLAADLDRAQKQAEDPKEAAKQLARWQEAIKEKLGDEASKKDAKEPLAERLTKLDAEQQALQQAAEKLSIPPKYQDAAETKKQVEEATQKARDALDKQDVAEAAKQMDKAKESLEKLSAQLPDGESRKREALAELKRLTDLQDKVSQQADEAMKKLADAGQDAEKQKAAKQELDNAAKKQAEIAQKLRDLDTPNQEALKAKADQAQQKALEDLRKQLQQNVKASQEAAKRELDRLQESLEGRNSTEQGNPHLAKQQKALAEATKQAQQQAAQKPGAEGQKQLDKALEKIAEQQKALNEQASKEQASREARDAMNKAQQALDKKDAGEAQKQQQAAAQALDKSGQPSQKAQGLPTKQQADNARKLAQEQRQLKQALEQMNKPMPASTPADLAKQQQQLAQQAQKLGNDLGQAHGEPAKQAAQQGQQAAEKLQQGKMQEALPHGESVAQKLQQLADSLGGNKTAQGKEAQQLAQQQQALNQKMQQQGQSPPQQALQQQTNDLAKQVQQMAQQSPSSPSLQKASQNAQQAQQAMQAAQQQSQQGNSQSAQKAQEMAAQALEQTAQNLSQAQQGQQAMQPTGQSLQQAQKQLGQSQQALQQGQMQKAQQASKQAAQQLADAAQEFSKQQQRGLPGAPPKNTPEHGTVGGGAVDINSLPPELRAHAGKSWGELPGELRTKLMQDMQKQYGDDYARRIKLYFEQLADRKKKS